jgi:hypothetical protein
LKNMNEFVKERNMALLSCDKELILEYMSKYDIDAPSNEYVFWVGVRKAIMSLGIEGYTNGDGYRKLKAIEEINGKIESLRESEVSECSNGLKD